MSTNPILNDNITFPADWRGKSPFLIVAGAILVIVSLVLYLATGEGLRSFLHSYLANYMFALTICLGALFFVMVWHLVRSGWSTAIRRIAELYAATIPYLALLFIPILVTVVAGGSALYEWNVGPGQGLEEIVERKLVYLNKHFFTIRTLVYFAIFILAARYFVGQSRAQDDSGDFDVSRQLQKWSGPGVILFSLALNYAAFDWVMSTDPAWFSTMFGVYIFATSTFSFMSVMILTCYLLQRRGRVEKTIRIEHYHDLAKFLFGFIVFWTYIAFSQFMLYWYGNIPEETLWYGHRMDHGWQWVGLLLIVFHFAVPLFALMKRTHRRNPAWLAGWAGFLLVMHWMDLTYLILPNVGPLTPILAVAHFVGWIGMVMIFLALFLWRVGETPIVAIKDPWLPDSLAYHNLP